MPKLTKVLVKRKKFIEAEIPLINSKVELIGNSPEELKGRTIKLDLTRQLRGKSVELLVKIKTEKDKAVAYPVKIKLMPYFIRRMIRKRISYVEDSFEAPSQESMLKIKPFLITRKRVSRVIRKTLRNKTKNWVEDCIAGKKDEEIFEGILSNKIQKPLSLMLKKTYPLSLCEIRVLEIVRPLKEEEIPKFKKIKSKKETDSEENSEEAITSDKEKIKDIKTEEDIKSAEEAIKETQKKAEEIEKKIEKEAKEKSPKKE